MKIAVAKTCHVTVKVDCGWIGVTQTECEHVRDCCWSPASPGSSEPWCFHKAIISPCFKLLPAHLSKSPFADASITRMSQHFLANFNVQGTGSVIASPGSVPALPDDVPGGYGFHWMRDGALSIKALIETSQVTGIDRSTIKLSLIHI